MGREPTLRDAIRTWSRNCNVTYYRKSPDNFMAKKTLLFHATTMGLLAWDCNPSAVTPNKKKEKKMKKQRKTQLQSNKLIR